MRLSARAVCPWWRSSSASTSVAPAIARSAAVGGEHGQRVVHDQHADQVLRQLGRSERPLVVPGGGIVVAERAVSVSEALMDGRDAGEIADLFRPFERAAVVGGGGRRLAQ